MKGHTSWGWGTGHGSGEERRASAHLETPGLHQETELKRSPHLEGHLHLPLLRPPASFLLCVTDHVPTVFKPRVEVEGNVAVTAASLEVHNEPRPRKVSWCSAACLLLMEGLVPVNHVCLGTGLQLARQGCPHPYRVAIPPVHLIST